MTSRTSVRTGGGSAKIGGTALLGLLVGGVIAIGVQYLIGRTLPAEYAKAIVATPPALEYVEVGRLLVPLVDAQGRSEERRVGKECVSTCRSRWSPYH